MKEFASKDVIYNTIRTFPNVSFFIYKNVYLDNERGNTVTTPLGQKNVDEINVNRTSNLVYPFVYKDSNLNAFKSVTTSEYFDSTTYNWGDVIAGSYPITAGITIEQYSGSPRTKVSTLKNILNYNCLRSPHFIYSGSIGSSSYVNKETQELTLVSIPSMFYGGQIKPGTIDLKFYITGTLIGEAQDLKRNGEIIEVSGLNTGSVAGLVLYNEGIILMTGSWNLNNSHTEDYRINLSSVAPAWKFFGVTGSGGNFPASSSFEMNFSGIQPIEHILMMTHAEVGELNHSNNPTYLSFGEHSTLYNTGSQHFQENKEALIANITKSPYDNFSASFTKETYISKVYLYDENRNVIGIAKLAKSLRKRELDSYLIKIGIDV